MYYSCRNRLLILALFCTMLNGCASVNKVSLVENTKKTPEISADSPAGAAFSRGDYANSASLYEKLLQKDPDNKDLAFYLAESLRMSGSTEKALSQYNNLIEKDKGNIAAVEGRGLCYLLSGDIDKALVDLNSVVEKDATRWRTLNAIGVTYSIAGKNEEAMKYYDMALAVSGNNPSIINNIALGVSFGGDSAKGISLLKNALSSMADGQKKKILENNLALIYGTSGKMDEAEAILRKNLPEPAVYNNLGFYAKISADKGLAWSYLSKAVSASPVYYEKAENNMRDLDAPLSSDSSDAAVAERNNIAPASEKDSGLSNAEVTALQTADSSGPKIPAVKAWRGTRKLPLPSLRPQY